MPLHESHPSATFPTFPLFTNSGGMVFTFFKADGLPIGASLVEEDKLELAKELKAKAAAKGCEFLLPVDVVVADKFAEDANTQTVGIDAIPDGWMGLDVGPKSVELFKGALADCKTVVWNGPMGVFEMDKFANGTLSIAGTGVFVCDIVTGCPIILVLTLRLTLVRHVIGFSGVVPICTTFDTPQLHPTDYLAEITEKGAISIIGGGDSVAAVEKAGLADKMSHISTGGGASLELLEGKVLPGVAALDEA